MMMVGIATNATSAFSLKTSRARPHRGASHRQVGETLRGWRGFIGEVHDQTYRKSDLGSQRAEA